MVVLIQKFCRCNKLTPKVFGVKENWFRHRKRLTPKKVWLRDDFIAISLKILWGSSVWSISAQGQSCTDACAGLGRICDLETIQGITSAELMISALGSDNPCGDNPQTNFYSNLVIPGKQWGIRRFHLKLEKKGKNTKKLRISFVMD